MTIDRDVIDKINRETELAEALRQWVIDALGERPVTDQHIGTRRELFNAVDKQVRARVDRILESVMGETEQRIEARLAMKGAIAAQRRYVEEELAALRTSFESQARQEVQRVLRGSVERYAEDVVSKIKRRVSAVVAKECAKQLARVFNPTNPKRKSSR